MGYEVALEQAFNSLGDVDLLVEGYPKVSVTSFRREMAQIAVLYTLIPWIITIPLRFFHSGVLANTGWATVLVVVGSVYIMLLSRKENHARAQVINVQRLKNIGKVTWALWSIYVGLSTCFTFGVWFASDIWFHRSINVTGPYMFASFVVSVVLPFVSVFVPLYFMRIQRLVQEQEVSV